MFWETTKQNNVRSPHASVAKVMPALIIIIAKIEEGALENTNTGTVLQNLVLKGQDLTFPSFG